MTANFNVHMKAFALSVQEEVQIYLLRPMHQVEAGAGLFVNERIFLVLRLRHSDLLISEM